MDPKNRPAIDIVIPVYNERENILSTLAAIETQVRHPVRILICYDHENDTTLEILKEYQGVLPIALVKNKGRFAHGAVMTGFETSDALAVISYMADDDYNAGIVDRMIELFWDGADVVCPSRFIKGGSMVGCRFQKAFLVRAVAFTLHYLGGLPIHDPTNGFRLFSRRLLKAVKIESELGFTYSIELAAKCHRLGWRMEEVPARWLERTQGKSRFKVWKWGGAYLKWYLYVVETSFFGKKRV